MFWRPEISSTKAFLFFLPLIMRFLNQKSLILSYLTIIIRSFLPELYYLFSGLVAIKTAVKLTIKTADHEPALGPTVICQLPV